MYVSNCYAEGEQMYGSQWNSIAQAPMAALRSDVASSPNVNDIFGDGNWDELGRIMESMTDQDMASCCRYT